MFGWMLEAVPVALKTELIAGCWEMVTDSKSRPGVSNIAVVNGTGNSPWSNWLASGIVAPFD